MANLNRTTLIGCLGHDPELRYTAGGTAVATFTLATKEKFRNKTSGELEDKTEWHNIVLWDKLAEGATEHLTRSSTIYVEGRLQTSKWVTKSGTNRTITEIVVDRMQMLDTPATEV
jgi:single-strand DNA-binding protein